MAQRLFDRIIFIAFCEDRRLLPEKTIPKAYAVGGFRDVTNPRWQSFKTLFHFIDVGNEKHGIHRYNGGLFAPHAVDDLELPDEPWTTFFNDHQRVRLRRRSEPRSAGTPVRAVDHGIGKAKESGLFGDAEKAERFASMPQSAKRKQLGVYYTPPELTSRIVQYTVEELIAERFAAAAVEFGVSEKDASRGMTPDDANTGADALRSCGTSRSSIRPAAAGRSCSKPTTCWNRRYNEVIGHLDQLGERDAKELAEQIPTFILRENLYGVDLSPEAVEITQLALWIRSASPGPTA